MSRIRFVLLLAGFLFLFSWGESPLAVTPEELIRMHGKKVLYQQRDSNRSEGIKPRLKAYTTPDLISVALKPVAGFGKDLPKFLFLKVPLKRPRTGNQVFGSSFESPYDMPIVTVREPESNYRLDNIKFDKSRTDRHLTFRWPTGAVLGPGKIAPGALQLMAEDYYDLIYPVILSSSEQPCELHYEFGVYAEDRAILLKSFRILSSSNRELIFSLKIGESPLTEYELITVSWQGTSADGKPVEPGEYIVEFDGEVKEEQGTIHFRSPSYQFQHDPALLQKK